jgi:hypothetical protein
VSEILHSKKLCDEPFSTASFRGGKDVYFKGTKRLVLWISNETFERDSRLYIHCQDIDARQVVIQTLKDEGVTSINEAYTHGSSVDVGVQFFHGWHWNE